MFGVIDKNKGSANFKDFKDDQKQDELKLQQDLIDNLPINQENERKLQEAIQQSMKRNKPLTEEE